MTFEWDDAKAVSNLGKHGVDFADAASVFDDERAMTIADDRAEEPRFVTMGRDLHDELTVVVYCHRDDDIRIISARRATRRERRAYEEQS